jgi:hypothetical protein
MTERTNCGACAGTQLTTFLDLGKTPLANKFPATVDETETWYRLGLCRCGNCGLVQGIEIISDEEIYGDDYGFYSGGSKAQLDYHRREAEYLLMHHPDQAAAFTVEIACNDGSLLRHFKNMHCLGVDPSAPAQLAIDAGLPVIKKPFTANLAREIREDQGPAGLVIAISCLAHIGDLSDVMTGIWELLSADGVAVVEVQYLPDLLVGNAIGQVYHEHRYFYSLTSFKHVANLHGLYVRDAELIELQGGGLRVTLGTIPSQLSNRARQILRTEEWLNHESAYESVQGRMDRNRDHLIALLEAERSAGRYLAGYAAAAKATTILNYCGIQREVLPYVIDTTSSKWGRFIPGVRIPIVSPREWVQPADTRLLLTSNYLGWLLRHDHEFTDNGGRWLVAEPLPMVI